MQKTVSATVQVCPLGRYSDGKGDAGLLRTQHKKFPRGFAASGNIHVKPLLRFIGDGSKKVLEIIVRQFIAVRFGQNRHSTHVAIQNCRR
jgi:hypothetical protein